MRNWQAWTCTLITFTGSGTIRSSIKQLQCNAYYFTGPNQVTRNILVRGYRLVEAVQQIISRRLDPERFHAGMEIKAVEITGGGEADYLVRAIASNEVRCRPEPGSPVSRRRNVT